MNDQPFHDYSVSYEGFQASSILVQARSPFDAAKDFALRQPNAGQDCVVITSSKSTAGGVVKFQRSGGHWSQLRPEISQGNLTNGGIGSHASRDRGVLQQTALVVLSVPVLRTAFILWLTQVLFVLIPTAFFLIVGFVGGLFRRFGLPLDQFIPEPIGYFFATLMMVLAGWTVGGAFAALGLVWMPAFTIVLLAMLAFGHFGVNIGLVVSFNCALRLVGGLRLRKE